MARKYEDYAEFVFTPHVKRIDYVSVAVAAEYPKPILGEVVNSLKSKEHQEAVYKQLLRDREIEPLPPVDPRQQTKTEKKEKFRMAARAAFMEVRGDEALIGA